MTIEKLSFQEAWSSATFFYVNDVLEDEIDDEVQELLTKSLDPSISDREEITPEHVFNFLREDPSRLESLLKDINLSKEKFLRIVSMLRQIGRIHGGFDSEWTINKIQKNISEDDNFLTILANLLVDGKRDPELESLIPRFYLESLNFREYGSVPLGFRISRYKKALSGSYGGKKGYYVENEIKKILLEIQYEFGVKFEQGRSRFINVDIDFAVPSLDDPWVIIMSTFQETTSSGQTVKARDMLSAYQTILQSNSRNNEQRVFVNFVDGGGWLARKRDYERLVNQCHYFVNLQNVYLIRDIVLKHVPQRYFD